MDDLPFVGRDEAVGDLQGHVQQPIGRPGLPGHRLAQALALDQLHDDVGKRILLPDVEHGDDVRVIQRGGRPGLPLEPLERPRAVPDRRPST